MRDRRATRAAITALMAALPAAAVLAPGQSLAQGSATPSAPQGVIPFQVRSSKLDYGDRVIVTGVTPTAPAAPNLELQFAPTGSSTWKTLAVGASTPGAAFRLSSRLTMSGTLRVIDPAPGIAVGAQAGIATGTTHKVVVKAVLQVRRRRLDVLAGTAVVFRGRLLPGVSGRLVRLEARSGRGWRTLARAHTTGRGMFTISYVPQGLGGQRLQMRFSGDRFNARFAAGAGMLTVFRQALASWYYDRSATACGFNAHYGVANTSLPCGAKVTLRLGSRSVTAVVDDRGPYVGGRVWDLGQNTAAALGFVGVETIWSTK
jgi:hypothetical protein